MGKTVSTGRRSNRQRGAILVVSLVMLAALTLLGVASINMSTANLRAVNNSQVRAESMAAIQQQLALVWSALIVSKSFTPPAGATSAVGGYSVEVTTPCLRSFRAILNSELNLSDANDLRCFKGSSEVSECAVTVWEATATASENFFGARTSVREAVSVKKQYSLLLANTAQAGYGGYCTP